MIPLMQTGATYSSELISSFFDLAHEHELALIIDETYRDFITTSAPPHKLFSSPLTPWRSTFIHLFSFSKSYCLPGHRLGAIVASPELLTTSVKKVLDCMQICPPRPIQQALGPLLPSLRGFVREAALALESRHNLFKDHLPGKWRVGAQGGYFAFVRHPFVRVRAVDVCRRLAEEVGVVTLPASFFSDARERGDGADGQEEESVEEEERWIRFSVANIPDEKVLKVCERLGECEKVFGWKM
jgi:aspartate/methionine/tyrosine aminotransferase